MQQNPDRQWQQWPLCPTLPSLFLSSLILLCNVTCAPCFFFSCYSVLPNTHMSRHLPHHCGGNICCRYDFQNYFHAPEFVCIFVLNPQRTEPRDVAAMHHRLSLQNRSLSDCPPSTGRLLETQYCPISARTPQ